MLLLFSNGFVAMVAEAKDRLLILATSRVVAASFIYF